MGRYVGNLVEVGVGFGFYSSFPSEPWGGLSIRATGPALRFEKLRLLSEDGIVVGIRVGGGRPVRRQERIVGGSDCSAICHSQVVFGV